jgi:hypothetical protein
MEERFFFYGIDVLSDDLIIHEAVEDTVLILPHGTQSQLAVRDTAAVGAQAADNILALLLHLEQRPSYLCCHLLDLPATECLSV